MWNWKPVFEDDEVACYLDIDSIVDPDEEEGFYDVCHRSIFKRAVAWVTIFIKSKEIVRYYIEERGRRGLNTGTYEDLASFLCLLDMDYEDRCYRVIPVTDHNREGEVLGQSAIIGETDGGLFCGLSGEWSPVYSEKTHEAVKRVFEFIFGRTDEG